MTEEEKLIANRERCKRWYRKHKEERRLYNQKYWDEHREERREFRANNVEARMAWKQKYRSENTIRRKAHYTINNLVRSGKISPLPCEQCGNINTEAHHEDYNKPLDVVWLCRQCHRLRHREIREQWEISVAAM